MTDVVNIDDPRLASFLDALTRLGMRHVTTDTTLVTVFNEYFLSRPGSPADAVDEVPYCKESNSATPEANSATPASSSKSESQASSSVTDEDEDTDDDTDEESSEEEESSNSLEFLASRSLRVTRFKCNCKYNDGKPCYTRFDEKEVCKFRMQYLCLTQNQLDIALLSIIGASLNAMPMPLLLNSKNEVQPQHEAVRAAFCFQGYRICKEFLKYIYGIDQTKLEALILHYLICGITVPEHTKSQSQIRYAVRALPSKDMCAVGHFLMYYGQANAVSAPGVLGAENKRAGVRLLPKSATREAVYHAYCLATRNTSVFCLARIVFNYLWKPFTGLAAVTLPIDEDLCWFCNVSIKRITNKKSSLKEVKGMQCHLDNMKREYLHYQKVCQEAKDNLPPHLQLGAHKPCSFAGTVHYSFDFSVPIHYPNDPFNPQPAWFKSARKCELFGVACEGLPKQVNFLLEEIVSCGQGPDVVVSLLHYFFEKFGLGEEHVHLHTYPYKEVGKNNVVMHYLLWRVLTGLHRSIKISFLMAGHGLLSCDWMFGLLKNSYRSNKVDCLGDIKRVIETSSHANVIQLSGTENGDVIVPIFAWTNFFKDLFKDIKDLDSFYHFQFTENSYKVKVKKNEGVDPQTQDWKRDTTPSGNPEKMVPVGINPARQWYLYEEVRPFVSEEYQDLVTPLPSCPKP